MRKCAYCLTRAKCPYKKGKKYFCSKEHKNLYFENDIKTLKKQIQIEFNKMITENQPCAYCGKRFVKMDCSHILSRGSCDHLRFDFLNVLPMCSRHHQFFWHDSPLEAIEWFKAKYPARYDYLLFAKNQFREWTAEELKQIREDIKNRNIKGLVRFYGEYELYLQRQNRKD
jgi:hypothetical protein